MNNIKYFENKENFAFELVEIAKDRFFDWCFDNTDDTIELNNGTSIDKSLAELEDALDKALTYLEKLSDLYEPSDFKKYISTEARHNLELILEMCKDNVDNNLIERGNIICMKC